MKKSNVLKNICNFTAKTRGEPQNYKSTKALLL